MTKINKLVVFMVILVGMFAFSELTVSAVSVTTTAGIQVTLTSEDGKTAVTGFSSGSISVKDAAEQTLDQGIDYSISMSDGTYTVTGLTVKQKVKKPLLNMMKKLELRRLMPVR